MWISIILTWCDWEDQSNNETETKSLSVINKFTDELKLNKENIKEDRFEWYNYADYWENKYYLDWYSIEESWIDPFSIINTDEFFDWWTVNYLADEMYWSLTEFSNNEILCYYEVYYDQDIPDELMAWEDDYDIDYDKAWADFYETATYTVILSCWEIPEDAPKFSDLKLDAFWEEPFWNASFRDNVITVFDVNWVWYYYLQHLQKEDNKIVLNGYNVKWSVEEAECIDGWKGDSHKYTISLNLTTNDWQNLNYNGCADESNFWFTAWEQGTLKTLIKKTNYKYKQPYKEENVWYKVAEIVWNYMEVDVYANEDNEYYSYQIIMEKDWKNWKVLFEGDGYNISDDKCEELNQYDNNLMEMFFLLSCPRW